MPRVSWWVNPMMGHLLSHYCAFAILILIWETFLLGAAVRQSTCFAKGLPTIIRAREPILRIRGPCLAVIHANISPVVESDIFWFPACSFVTSPGGGPHTGKRLGPLLMSRSPAMMTGLTREGWSLQEPTEILLNQIITFLIKRIETNSQSSTKNNSFNSVASTTLCLSSISVEWGDHRARIGMTGLEFGKVSLEFLLQGFVCYQRMHRVWPASELGAEWKSLNAIPLQVTELRARERRRWGIQDHLGAGLQPEFKLNCWYIWYIWLLPFAKVRKVILGWMYTDFCMDKSSKQLKLILEHSDICF